MKTRVLAVLRRRLPVWLGLGLALAGCGTPAKTPLVLAGVTVVDVETGRLVEGVNIAIDGTRITAAGAEVEIGPGARVVDATGLFALPGLWDMHTHSLWSADALATFLPLYVAQGITGIRDMGGTLASLAAARDSLLGGRVAWPRIVAAGLVVDGAPPVDASISVGVADSATAYSAVDSLARAGADFIKVYTLLEREVYFALVRAAKAAALPVAGHVPASVTPTEAARAGQRSIEHLLDELDLVCPVAEPAACERLAGVFREEGTWLTPTLAALRPKARVDDPAYAEDPRLAYVVPALRNDWLSGRVSRIERGPEYLAGKRRHYADEVELTRFFHERGVPMLAGSDAGVPFSYPGFSLHDELGLLVEAGLSPLDALRAATIGPATFLGARDSLGTLATGWVADLVLLRENPLLDISATRSIEAVVLRGRYLDRATLDGIMDEVRRVVATR